MKIITAEIRKKLPPLYSQDGKKPEDVKVVFKLFNPYGAGTWYITEGDLEEGRLFGLCCIHEAELGYVDLNELLALRIRPFGGKIERDRHYSGTLADAMKYEKYGNYGRAA